MARFIPNASLKDENPRQLYHAMFVDNSATFEPEEPYEYGVDPQKPYKILFRDKAWLATPPRPPPATPNPEDLFYDEPHKKPYRSLVQPLSTRTDTDLNYVFPPISLNVCSTECPIMEVSRHSKHTRAPTGFGHINIRHQQEGTQIWENLHDHSLLQVFASLPKTYSPLRTYTEDLSEQVTFQRLLLQFTSLLYAVNDNILDATNEARFIPRLLHSDMYDYSHP